MATPTIADQDRIKSYIECFLCGRGAIDRLNEHEARKVAAFQIMICRICDRGNWDGINPRYEDKLLNHLEEKGLPEPRRNSNGLIPLPPRGS